MVARKFPGGAPTEIAFSVLRRRSLLANVVPGQRHVTEAFLRNDVCPSLLLTSCKKSMQSSSFLRADEGYPTSVLRLAEDGGAETFLRYAETFVRSVWSLPDNAFLCFQAWRSGTIVPCSDGRDIDMSSFTRSPSTEQIWLGVKTFQEVRTDKNKDRNWAI